MGIMKEFIKKLREWQKENPEWEFICDMDSTDHLYVQWNELPKKERMSWIGVYGREAKEAFEEFSTKPCKVETKAIDSNLKLYDFPNWPKGHAMQIFRTYPNQNNHSVKEKTELKKMEEV